MPWTEEAGVLESMWSQLETTEPLIISFSLFCRWKLMYLFHLVYLISVKENTTVVILKRYKFDLGVQNEAGQRLTEFCQENVLVIENNLFQQHKRRFYPGTSPGGQYWNQIDYILCSQRWRSSIQSAKTRPGSNCSSDHELLIDKVTLKLKKVEKTTRPFRYDLNQVPCDYTVEVTNRFKGLDPIDSAWKQWTEVHDIVQGVVIKTIPKKKKCKKEKWSLKRPYK